MQFALQNKLSPSLPALLTVRRNEVVEELLVESKKVVESEEFHAGVVACDQGLCGYWVVRRRCLSRC